MTQITPMVKQYLGIKGEYPDSILFFRMGDFYEMFFEDAKVASRILGITLTARGVHNGQKVPMCGVPHHSARSYIARLIRNGQKVAICEQVENPKQSTGIVKRDVVRVVTPGSAADDGDVDSKSNLYMAAVAGRNDRYGLAHVDLSTGVFRVTEIDDRGELKNELGRISPAELLLPEGGDSIHGNEFDAYYVERLDRDAFDRQKASRLLKEQFGVKSLAGFGCDGMDQGIIAAGAVIHYLKETQKANPDHIKDIKSYHVGQYMFLDESTIINLELFRTIRRQTVKGSLFDILDKTVTPMGARLLKRWIGYPLLDVSLIRKRLGAVSELKDHAMLREEIRVCLEDIHDLERLNGRIVLGRANARDLIALKGSAGKLPFIKKRLAGTASQLLNELSDQMDSLQDLADIIDEAICDEPPATLKEGGMIREGYDRELDELIQISRDGKAWLVDLAAEEQKRTGIPNLKIGFNKVFGYFIEVSKANVPRVPSDYIRKQTLVNAERYITESLKTHEEKVLGAEEKRVALEERIFGRIRARIAAENQRIKKTAALVAAVDSLAGLAETAELNHYVRPDVDEGGIIRLQDGRHPVIEQTVKEEEFVPNDVFLDDKEQQIIIITGPNMAGKSTILRQTALTVLMAQMGSFVPVSQASVGIVDRIFTRIGASDDLTKGQSTFMVEMNETANILRHATPRSLVILDEIGRGTSTYDGLSIAWAVAEALHDRDGKGVRTLFATHYHELTDLLTTKQRVKNFNIAVKEWNDQIIFLRKLIPGGTSRSYGIQVARIAGLPEQVLERAKEILENLEGSDRDEAGRPRRALSKGERTEGEKGVYQLHLFGGGNTELEQRLGALDITTMTPVEALVELNRLITIIKKKDDQWREASISDQDV